MKSPFGNDIFALIYQAFKNLYPDKECSCFWNPDLQDAADDKNETVYGLTQWEDNGDILVFVSPTLPVCDCAEILSHELAHVAVGKEHDHDEVWEKAFDDIFNEYNRLGEELFNPDDKAKVATQRSGKDYTRRN